MRGKNTLYNDIIPSSIQERGRKSHRNTFLEERDDALAHRYYFYAYLCRCRYDDCLVNLSREFFLSHNVIIQRLNKRTDLIKELVGANTNQTELKRMYGHLNWLVFSRN
jgi:hypothetical protein